MAAIIIRNIPDEDHRALKIRAAEHNRSTEAEVRSLIAEAVRPAPRIKMGTELAALGRELDLVGFNPVREPDLTDPAIFE